MANDPVILLRCDLDKVYRKKIEDAEMVIDKDLIVVKDRDGLTPRKASEHEIAAATEVYG